MINASVNPWGIVIEMDHNDTEAVISAATQGGGGLAAVLTPVLVAANVATPIVLAIIAVLGAWIAAEVVIIKAVDKGDGVYLTLPWPAILTGAVFLIVPTTRPPFQPAPTPTWSQSDEGYFGTDDASDRISYKIEHNIISQDSVIFKLVLGNDRVKFSGWHKAIIIRDGLGSQWTITAKSTSAPVEKLIRADHVRNGQFLTFRKPKFLGIWVDVLNLGSLNHLHGGDVVTFTWEKDH